MTTPNIVVDDALKSQLAQCAPGQTKSYSVSATMGSDGTVTLSPDVSSEEQGEPAAPVVVSKKTVKRPPIIAAVMPA